MAESAISVILAALVAGAATTAGQAVKDAYQGLKELIKRKFDSDSTAKGILDKYEKNHKSYEGALKESLTELGADKDKEILEAAKKVNELNDPEGAATGKYNINISGGTQGVVGSNPGTVNMGK
ncbi:hypothetical protein [Nostoc cycadae]|uniref:Uncharacterized protein n=1 Tax=Nostoc cycadae WK-1 TaxID=1861711 RepID=A0A2H6LMT0_9NOSO|nr:hypothetical protein [Nostoc cycadae]GBE94466.1 hypothetical protein NCWK1_4242 [Nostoc cycadae WK-1]